MTSLSHSSGSGPVSEMDQPLTGREKRWRRWRRAAILIVAVLAIAGFLGFLSLQRTGDLAVSAANIQTALVEHRQVTEAAALVGRVEPIGLVQLSSPETARITKLHLRSGDQVKAGDPIVTLSNPERELAISDRLARIQAEMFATATARAGLADAENQERRTFLEAVHLRNEAAENLRRQEVLLERRLVNEAFVAPLREQLEFRTSVAEELRTALERNQPSRQSQRAAADAYLSQLRDNQAAALKQLDGFVVRAPVAGRVLGLDRQIGEAVTAGDTLGQVDPGLGAVIVAQLDAFYASRVSAGQSGSIDIAGRTIPIEVVHVSPEIREGGFRVELELRDEIVLNPGQTLQGRINLAAASAHPTVPAGAFLEQTSGAWIFVIDPDSRTARRREIRTGIRTLDWVAVTSGLRPGERVIVSSYRDFGDAEVLDLTGEASWTN